MAEMESLWNILTQTVGLQLPVAVGLLLLALGYIIYRKCTPFQVLQQYGIKGPRPSFFFGNYRQMRKLGWLKFSEALYEQYGPVCGFYIGRQPCVLIADPEMLKQVMAGEYESFLHRNILILEMGYKCANRPRALFEQEGNEWKRLRKILSPMFSSMKIKTMVPHMKKVCDSLMKRFAECASSEKSVDVLTLYGQFTIQTIMACGFGRDIDILQGEADFLAEAAGVFFTHMHDNQGMSLESLDFILSNFPFVEPLIGWLYFKLPGGKVRMKLTETVEGLVNAKEKSGESGKGGEFKDMLQMMLDAKKDSIHQGGETLTNEEIASNGLDLLLAGYETTANTLAYTTYLLATNPSVQERLYSEIEEYFENNTDTIQSLYDATVEIQYLDMVINEALRLYPPAPRMWRECLKTTEINGVTIPKGTVVHIPFYLLQHNPHYWPDPEKFDPERFSPEEKAKRPHLTHMPFGWGPLQCVGMRFGLMEVKMALIEILKKYKFVQAPDTEVPLQTIVGLSMNPKNGVFLKISPRA